MKEKQEEWQELCRQAAIEQDPNKLLELTRRIDELLAEKQGRLNSRGSAKKVL